MIMIMINNDKCNKNVMILKYLLSRIYDYNSNPNNKWTIKNINSGIQRDNSLCGLFKLMHEEHILRNEDIGSINQDQINEYKKKVFENITQNKYILN